jgi:DNA polymerase
MADGTRDELHQLVTGFRAALEARAGQGAYGVPAGPSRRSELPEPSQPPPPADTHTPTLASVRDDLGDCQRCGLAATRQNIVFGVGAPDAQLMFVGEAPGAEEDRQGEPFVGASGELLDKMIKAMGWSRDTVYIANVLKCRPPGNRDPKPDEVQACEPFLARQIEMIRPRIIVTLGKPAAHLLLRSNAPISALRGSFHEYRGIKLMPTFHPAYLLREPARKRETWSDLKQVMTELASLGIEPSL